MKHSLRLTLCAVALTAMFVGVVQAAIFTLLMLFFIKMAITDPHAAHLLAALEGLDPDALSPRDALEALYRLKRVAAGAEAP